ncbi:hypothetical protein FH972_006000 [Carpinus fangiana]|jgi:glutaredoxin 3|uniref:Glutaredoxin domain-containing protein n=1 Tax=Carpinus fangiana TaxID=176857 RepID=A0A5N6QU75_9ROSI|nr:hypothetical protein FH972_006000 [Carpinus fangiana]
MAAELITTMVAERPVVIFSKSACGMSHSIKTLIRGFGANPTVYELDQIPNGQQIERELVELGCQPTVPAIFIEQKFIGGASKIMSLQVRNELVPMLRRARAIWV